jgi:hypothetical protein
MWVLQLFATTKQGKITLQFGPATADELIGLTRLFIKTCDRESCQIISASLILHR